jgi:hypothetical protein
MSTQLDDAAVERLTKLLGMLGSDHDGERASAALKADQLIRSRGLTWQQILLRDNFDTAVEVDAHDVSVKEQINFCLDHGCDIVTAWEWGFLNGIRDWPNSLTAKQRKKLEQLFRKVKAARSAS